MTMISAENKSIKVFIDTNVIIDALTLRDLDYFPSREIWRHIIQGKIKGYICSKQITDIYYIFRKYYKNKNTALIYLRNIIDSFEILPFLKGDILACLKSEIDDFEDAVLCEVAKVNMIPVLITNNIKHFHNAKVLALTPEQFMLMYKDNL